MSRHTPHLCAHPGCPTVLLEGPGRCPTHKGKPRPGTNSYGARWHRTRNAYIRAHPDCERCGRPGLDVHHRDHQGPTGPRGHDPTNLQTLCRSCHRRETEHAKRAHQGWGGKAIRTLREQAQPAGGPETRLGGALGAR